MENDGEAKRVPARTIEEIDRRARALAERSGEQRPVTTRQVDPATLSRDAPRRPSETAPRSAGERGAVKAQPPRSMSHHGRDGDKSLDPPRPLTGRRALIWRALAEHGPQTIREVAKRLDVHRTVLGPLFRGLEKDELLRKAGERSDGGRPAVVWARTYHAKPAPAPEPAPAPKPPEPGWITDARERQAAEKEAELHREDAAAAAERAREDAAKAEKAETRVCGYEGCGVEFEPTDPRQLYHTTSCQESARRQREGTEPLGTERDCAGCGDAFTPDQPRTVYCSDDCRDTAKRRQQTESYRRRKHEKEEAMSEHATGTEDAPRRIPEEDEEGFAKAEPAVDAANPGLKPELPGAVRPHNVPVLKPEARYFALLLEIADPANEGKVPGTARDGAMAKLEALVA